MCVCVCMCQTLNTKKIKTAIASSKIPYSSNNLIFISTFVDGPTEATWCSIQPRIMRFTDPFRLHTIFCWLIHNSYFKHCFLISTRKNFPHNFSFVVTKISRISSWILTLLCNFHNIFFIFFVINLREMAHLQIFLSHCKF